jgi:signal transduction histidine kinase/CheY-like chemotaxis protein
MTLLLAVLLGANLPLCAQEEQEAIEDTVDVASSHRLLIINSYNEQAAWPQHVMSEVIKHVSMNNDIFVSISNMHDTGMANDSVYNLVADNIFKRYHKNHPRYVVLIGNLAFTLRDRIKEHWGDIPMIVLSGEDTVAPTPYYYTAFYNDLDADELTPIKDLRPDYNFTFIHSPAYVEETLDLMVRMMPQMKTLLFASDQQYLNQAADRTIRTYLEQNHPDIQYRHLTASEKNELTLRADLLKNDSTTGILFSTWSYERTSTYGTPITSGGDFRLRLVTYSHRPVFALRGEYVNNYNFDGAYVYDAEEADDDLRDALTQIIHGTPARDIPFYYVRHAYPLINYKQAVNDGLKLSECPRITEYINRPPTFWQTYQWHILAAIALLLGVFAAITIYIISQRRRIAALHRYDYILRNMPVVYTQGRVESDHKGHVTGIHFHDGNLTFEKNFSTRQEDTSKPYFQIDGLPEMVETLMKQNGRESLSFTQHFAGVQKTYSFLVCQTYEPNLIDVFAVDVTGQVKAEAELRDVNKTLEMTLSAARIIPWHWDLESGIITCEAPRILFHRMERLRRKPIRNLNTPKNYTIAQKDYFERVHPDDRPNVKFFYESLRDGNMTHCKTEFRVVNHIEGRRCVDWIEVNAITEQVGDDQKPKALMGSLLIITTRKQQEQALIMAREKARESDRLKSAFLANMSHEIRTPLNAIVGFSNLLGNTDDADEKKQFVSIIENNNQLLLQLISDILDLSKIEANTLEFSYHRTDINELVNNMKKVVSQRVRPDVVLNVVEGMRRCIVNGDQNRLSQILINLLTNACKFTSKGSITLGYELRGQELYFYVRDTGIGIAPDKIDQIFTRFVKLNHFAQGSGLGLAITQSLVEKMGGHVGAQSDGEGKGSTFWFTIPYLPMPEEEANQQQAIQQAKQVISHQMFTILIAEDNESNFLLFKSILGKEYQLIHAWDGREAVEYYKKYQPNLILMDINMPNMNGYEATREIRKLSATVPIIAVTAYAYSSEKEQILNSGFNSYIAKPLNASELNGQILNMINKSFILM